MTEYLIGTGGWAYLNVPGKPPLKTYSKIFNSVEVNYTFYEYPDVRTVEHWRRVVPRDFVFTVRCHQDLTHRIGLRPVEEAYRVFNRMINYCRILEAPFLHLETPKSYVLDDTSLREAKDFFSSVSLKGVRVAWEIRSAITENVVNLLRELDIVHSVDLSREEPAFKSDVVYTRLFGKGKHNIYQFVDEELEEIDKKVLKSEARRLVASFHGLRMSTDAVRFKEYKKTGAFLPVTSFTGVDSVRQVMSEDAEFPSSKEELVEDQGWKVVDVTADKRVRLSELLSKIPDKTYSNLNEVVKALEV